MIEEVKQIFLFHNLENPIRIQTDEQSNCYWDILIHTQDHEKVSAILGLMANKTNLFSLKVPALDQIQPLPVFVPPHPDLPPQKTGGRDQLSNAAVKAEAVLPKAAPVPEKLKVEAAPVKAEITSGQPANAEKPGKVTTTVDMVAEQRKKEREEQEVLQRKKYAEYADKIKGLFPEGSVTVAVKEKEDAIQLSFGTNAALCEIARKNLEDYKKQNKVDAGNNLSLPRSNKLAQLLSDERQEIWKSVFKQYAAGKDKKTIAQNERKAPTITVKNSAMPRIRVQKTSADTREALNTKDQVPIAARLRTLSGNDKDK